MGRGLHSISQAVVPTVPLPRNTAPTFLEATGSPTFSPRAASAQLRPQGNCHAAHLPLAPGQEPPDSSRNTERALGSPPAPARPLLLLETPSYPPDACCHAREACRGPGQGSREQRREWRHSRETLSSVLEEPARPEGSWRSHVDRRQRAGERAGTEGAPRTACSENQGRPQNQTAQTPGSKHDRAPEIVKETPSGPTSSQSPESQVLSCRLRWD